MTCTKYDAWKASNFRKYSQQIMHSRHQSVNAPNQYNGSIDLVEARNHCQMTGNKTVNLLAEE